MRLAVLIVTILGSINHCSSFTLLVCALSSLALSICLSCHHRLPSPLSSNCAGRMASVANQMGVSQASEPLTEMSKGVVGMAGFFGGEVRRCGACCWEGVGTCGR